MEALAYTQSCALQETLEGLEKDYIEIDFFDWVKAPNSAWLNLLALGVLVSCLSALPASANVLASNVRVDTPKNGCLNARLGPGMEFIVNQCVSNGAVLKPVVSTQGDWLKLSSGRWVYAPYTSYAKGDSSGSQTKTPPPIAGGRARRVSTPKGSCLNARLGPGKNYKVYDCVTNGAALKTVVSVEGDWLKLSSGRWVYGPYTSTITAVNPAPISTEGNTADNTMGSGGPVSLTLGSRGDAVRQVQEKLITFNYKVGKAGADGVYGPETKRAVEEFQKANSLTVDGVVGPKTRSLLEL